MVVGVAIVWSEEGGGAREMAERAREGCVIACSSASPRRSRNGVLECPDHPPIHSSKSAPSSRPVDRRRTAPRSLKLRNAALLRRTRLFGDQRERERGTETMHGVKGGKSEQSERGYTRSAPRIGAERRGKDERRENKQVRGLRKGEGREGGRASQRSTRTPSCPAPASTRRTSQSWRALREREVSAELEGEP